MAILLHPNKHKPERYRVWDRELKEQAYYPLTAAGKKAAKEHEKKVRERKKARALMRDLAINKLFAYDGSIKGLQRKVRTRSGYNDYECFKLYANRKQTELTVTDDTFEFVYLKAQNWLMEQYGIESTLELRRMFRKAKPFYWQSLLSERA